MLNESSSTFNLANFLETPPPKENPEKETTSMIFVHNFTTWILQLLKIINSIFIFTLM